MDEPLAGVDAARKAEILDLVRAVRARFGATIIYVSHDLDEVAALADDLMIIAGGRIERAGPAAPVFADPESPLADRPDARALLDGALAAADEAHGVSTVKAGEAMLTIPWSPAAVGAGVRVQIFARDVTLAAAAPEAISTQNVLSANVRALRLRPDRLALAALDTPAGPLLATITQPAAERLALKPGQRVFALVKASAFAPRGE
jgi:molybdate transport system ATP-binding protein